MVRGSGLFGALLLSTLVACGEEEETTCTNHSGSDTVVCRAGHEPDMLAWFTPDEPLSNYSSFFVEEFAESRLVLHQGFAYWGSGARDLFRTDTERGTTELIYEAPANCGSVGFERADSTLYLVQNCRIDQALFGSIWSVGLDGSGVTELYRSAAELQRIAVDPDGRWVYTFDYEDDPILIAVDPATRTADALTLPERLRGLAADAGHAYVGWPNWIEDGSNVVARVETEEAALGSLGTVVDETQALEVSGDYLYRRRAPRQSDENVDRLERLALTAPELGFEQVADGPVPQFFAVADDFVYGAGRYDIGDRKGDSCIVRYRLSDGAAQPLIVLRAGFRPAGVAVDDSHVYWIDYDAPFDDGNSRLMRAPR